MYWLDLFRWSHGSTGSEDPCLLFPGRYYRSQQAVLPLPASGTTSQGGTTVGHHGTTVTPTEHTHPADLPCSPPLGFCISFLVFFVVAFWGGQVVDLVST